jgi:RNA polymerase sigma factor for flagellar operon FliA
MPSADSLHVARGGLTLNRAQREALVRDLVNQLPERERTLIERMYFAGLSLDEGAASNDVSRSWACRVHARAIAAMQRELRKSDAPH